MISTQMFMRMARYDFPKLLDIFNGVCDKANVPDSERKVVFDTQAEYILFASGHVEGVKLSAEAIIAFSNKTVGVKDLPELLQDRFLLMQTILRKYGRQGEDILEAATSAILVMYMHGGVFTNG
jgi:hypothetical protein